ncbi:YfbM family protein [soil metagenome]
MSMIGNYLRLPEAELQKVLEKPEDILEFLYPEDDSEPFGDRHLDTDKAWQLTHFLLTGDAWVGAEPLRNAVLGGTEIGEEDVGYGPARYLTPSQVKSTSEALAAIYPEQLWQRFDLDAVRKSKIYPSGWEGNEMDRTYIVEYYTSLQTFFAAAAVEEQQAMILYLN